jgi:hypothetical protein
MKAQVISDGRTVWVNAPTGECLARFGRFGIDIHRPVAEQEAGAPQCLFCTHSHVTRKDWDAFRAATLEHHGVHVANSHQPRFLGDDVAAGNAPGPFSA